MKLTTFIAIGDMGKGTPEQHEVAKLIKKLKKYKYSFVTGLGDNIYPNGCSSIHDKNFKTKFEDPYSILSNSIRWYMCLGNHDYGYDYDESNNLVDNSKNQLDYTKHSKKWYMPARYYSFVKGPIEFFYLDTNFDRKSESFIQKQLQVMKQKLDTSKKRWKIVCGHHTWRSIAGHGNAEKRLEIFLDDLFKDTKPHLYMCGHDHCKSLMVKNDITLVISGNGGEVYDEPRVNLKSMKDCTLKYFSPSLGVALVKADKHNLNIDFYNTTGLKEYSYKIN